MKMSPRQKKLLKWAVILIVPLWLFNHYIVMPGCMRFSKPVTMVLEWNEKQIAQGTPKRATFRIPSAYLMTPVPNRENRRGGKVDFIEFSLNTQGGPGCRVGKGLEKWEKAKVVNDKVYVSLKPGIYRNSDHMKYRICTRYPEISSDIAGFKAYEGPSRCYIPIEQPEIPVFFACMNADKIRGCTAWTYYQHVRLKYGLNQHSMLENWKDVHAIVLRKIDQFVVTIDK